MDFAALNVTPSFLGALQLVAVTTVLFVVACITSLLWSEPTPALPRVGAKLGVLNHKIWAARKAFAINGHSLISRTYRDDGQKNYPIHTMSTDRVIVAPKYLEELRMLPESQLSSSVARVESVVGQYSGVDILLKGHLGTEVIRGPLTRNLPLLIPDMVDELHQSLSGFVEAQKIKEPALYSAYALVHTVISQVTSRVFVGTSRCHNSAWTEVVNSFPMDAYGLGATLFPVPSFLRPFVARWTTTKRRLDHGHGRLQKLLFPMSSMAPTKELTVLNFLLQASKDETPKSLTSRILVLTGAALHTSSMASVHMIYDLCARREYIESLRAEARAVLSEHGQWTLAALKQLHRLGSFMKESQRVNTVAFLGFDRKVMSPITLSDGLRLPRGAIISMPGGPMSQDDAYYPRAEYFDPFRFCGGSTGRAFTETDFTASEPGNLNWGSGRFTCPGRWYASALIKLLLATLLLDYDFAFPDGQITRPPNVQANIDVHPDRTQLINIRKVERP